jgi:hypothetical protein
MPHSLICRSHLQDLIHTRPDLILSHLWSLFVCIEQAEIKFSKTAGTPFILAVLRIRDVYPGSQIPDPDFYPSRIPDPGSRIPDPKTVTKERGEKNKLSYLFMQPQISQNCKLF